MIRHLITDALALCAICVIIAGTLALLHIAVDPSAALYPNPEHVSQ